MESQVQALKEELGHVYAILSILIRRSGGRVEVSDYERVAQLDGRLVMWHDPSKRMLVLTCPTLPSPSSEPFQTEVPITGGPQ